MRELAGQRLSSQPKQPTAPTAIMEGDLAIMQQLDEIREEEVWGAHTHTQKGSVPDACHSLTVSCRFAGQEAARRGCRANGCPAGRVHGRALPLQAAGLLRWRLGSPASPSQPHALSLSPHRTCARPTRPFVAPAKTGTSSISSPLLSPVDEAAASNTRHPRRSCFYRAFGFSLLERLMTDKDELERFVPRHFAVTTPFELPLTLRLPPPL